jgi:hypothetical protein
MDIVNGNLILGAAALAYGLFTIYLRFTDPSKLGKLEPMKKQWGETAGTVIHWIGYTVMPLLLGAVLIFKGLND